MEKTIEFYDWFTLNGGLISNESLEKVHEKVNQIILTFSSSLRPRAEEIKEKHNYQFNFKNRE